MRRDEATDRVRVDSRRCRRAGSSQGTEGLQRSDHKQSESVAVASDPGDTTDNSPNRLRAGDLLHTDNASLRRVGSGALSPVIWR